MIFYRGIISRIEWDPTNNATNLIEALFESYVRGKKIWADREVVYERDGALHVSFGRGKGHTSAILQFLDGYEDLQVAVITHDPAMLSGVSALDPNPLNRYYSVAEADSGLRGWYPDVVFIDLSWDDYNAHLEPLYRLTTMYRNLPHRTPIISTISDGVRTSSIKALVTIQVEDYSINLQKLVSGYGISKKYIAI